MAKRSGLLRIGSRAHKPGDAGGEKIKKIKKKSKIKVKAAVRKTSVATKAAAAVAAAPVAMDDMFAMALPAVSSGANPTRPGDGKKRGRFSMVPDEEIERPAAFEDESKETMFQRILSSAKGATHQPRIAADEHRVHMNALKAAKAERAARKMERFKAHLKC